MNSNAYSRLLAGLVGSALVATGALVAVPHAAAAGVPTQSTPGSTVQVNLTAGGQPSATSASLPVISDDGSTVVYSAREGISQLFAHDRRDGTTTPVGASDQGAFEDVYGGDLSADGRYVAFVGKADWLVPECPEYDDNELIWIDFQCFNVFLRDLSPGGGTTLLSSDGADGGTGRSFDAHISADGSRVVFASDARLTGDDQDDASDVYLYETGAAGLQLVSVGGDATNYFDQPDISPDGNVVAFATDAQLAPSDIDDWTDTYVLDLTSDAVERLSAGATSPSLNEDGSVAAFATQQPLDAVRDPEDWTWDVYVIDRQTAAISLVRGDADLTQSDNASISSNGQHVVFRAYDEAADLPGTYAYNVATAELTVESVRSDGTLPEVFTRYNGGAYGSISDDGRFVAFTSTADDMTVGNVVGSDDVYVRDRGLAPDSASGAGSASTDNDADGATFLDPVEVAVSGSPGAVTIQKLPPAQGQVASFQILGQAVDITAAPASGGQWLTFEFRIDASLLPAGVPVADIALLRNGVALDPCADGTDPGPCVASRTTEPDGDLLLVAHSPAASTWAVAVGLPTQTPSDTTPPSITLTAPTDGAQVRRGASLLAAYSCADDVELASCVGDVANGASIDTSTVGARQFTVTATDAAGNQATTTVPFTVVYPRAVFAAPIDPQPVTNVVLRGSLIPVRFSLGGNQGLAVLADPPTSASITCSAGRKDIVEQTVRTGAGRLTYDSRTKLYTYVWRAERAWHGTCRELVLNLSDGTQLRADFRIL